MWSSTCLVGGLPTTKVIKDCNIVYPSSSPIISRMFSVKVPIITPCVYPMLVGLKDVFNDLLTFKDFLLVCGHVNRGLNLGDHAVL